ncbi:MBL fold metallo-hydrolase [Vulcanococcus limneticus]|uniref:MBL fold metallo-hydrolase n=1 Tax=Vulcanococcus limneticus TaxID=2170428 RepID=UPI00398C1CC7
MSQSPSPLQPSSPPSGGSPSPASACAEAVVPVPDAAAAAPAAWSPPTEAGRPPQPVLPGLWLFAPSRDSHGGSAWWLEHPDGGLLIDCPGWTEANLAFLARQAGGRIVLTSREGHGRCRRFQQALGWPVLVQEQEAYLLPGVERLETFAAEWQLSPRLQLLWTPGPTPGSCVLLASGCGVSGAADGSGAAQPDDEPAGEPGDILFCGRLLSPTGPGLAAPLRSARSFHWGRWLRSLEALRRRLPPHSPRWIASGAGLGALRGGKLIEGGRAVLEGLDLEALAAAAAPAGPQS